MSQNGFSCQYDAEVANYRQLKRAVLASEARRKEEQRQRRISMGLPDIEDKRGIIHRFLRKRDSSRSQSTSEMGVRSPSDCEEMEAEAEVVDIRDFLKTRP